MTPEQLGLASAMNFGRPDNLTLFWLLPLAVAIAVFAARRRQRRLHSLFGPEVRTGTWRTFSKSLLFLVALALLILGLSQPRWGFVWLEAKRSGSDIAFVVDVSRSMLAEDVSPSRMVRARRELLDLLDVLPGDRVALVAMAGQAFIECPLTEDYGAARMFIDYLAPDLIPVQGTDLAQGIRTAIRALDAGGEGTDMARAVILLSDGEDLAGQAQTAADEARARGIKIYTVGIGSKDGAPIPEPDGGFKKDLSGNMVISKPDETALKGLASVTGGEYVRSESGGTKLAALYTQSMRPGLKQKEFDASRQKLWFERFQWFLGCAFLALLLESFLSDPGNLSWGGRKSRTVLGTLFVGCFLAFFSSLGLSASSEGYRAFEKGEYGDAAEAFANDTSSAADEAAYNQGVSQFRAGDFAGAAASFGKGAASRNRELSARSFFNLGNTELARGNVEAAVSAYKSALALAPDDAEAGDNLEYAEQVAKKKQESGQEQSKKNDGSKSQDAQEAQRDKSSSAGGGEKKQDSQNPSSDKNSQEPSGSGQQEQNSAANPQAKTNSAAKEGPSPATEPSTPNASTSPGANGSGQPDAHAKDKPRNGRVDAPKQAEGAAEEEGGSQAGDQTRKQPVSPDAPSKGDVSQEQKKNQVTAGAKAPAGTKANSGTASGNDSREEDAEATASSANILSKEQAEQVLRQATDQAKKYLLVPNRGSPKKLPEKDW